jgi:hypothetical protein
VTFMAVGVLPCCSSGAQWSGVNRNRITTLFPAGIRGRV